MTKKQVVFIAAIAIIILTIVGASIGYKSAAPPQPLVALQGGDPPPQGGCSQCLGNQCYSAPCNLECKQHGDWCETIVMGGSAAPYSPETKAANGDFAQFYLQRIQRLNGAMETVGLEVGDTVTHVNNEWSDSQLEFAKKVLELPKGTTLRGIRKNGEAFFVTL